MLRFAIAICAAALTACSTSDTLQPVTAAAPVPVSDLGSTRPSNASVAAVIPRQEVPQTSALALAPTDATPTSAPAIDAAITSTHLEIAPVTGAPRGAVPPLSRAMAERGREIGLDFTRGGGITTHTLRGFFSINDDGGEVRVVYIWDVVTPEGRRVHRIRGQETIPGTLNGADPWRGVSPDTMRRIGRSTIDRFAQWRQRSA